MRRWVLMAVMAALGGSSCKGTTHSSSEKVGESQAALSVDASMVTVTLSIPNKVTYPDVVVATTEGWVLGPGAKLTRDDHQPALATNTGSHPVVLGTKSLSGTVESNSAVFVEPFAHVLGDIVAKTVTVAPRGQVDGTIDKTTSLEPFQQVSFSVSFPGNSASSLWVLPFRSAEPAPGRYTALYALPESSVLFRSGDYYVDELGFAPGSRILVRGDGPVRLFVHHVELWEGKVTLLNDAHDFLLVQTEGGVVRMGASFQGTFVGPSVDLVLGGCEGGHRGAFFSKSVFVEPNASVVYDPPNVLASLVAPTGDLARCAELVRPPSGLQGKDRDRAYQAAIARECSAPGAASCSIDLVAWANVDYTAAALALAGQTLSPAQYLALVRDRTRKRRAAERDPARAQALCQRQDQDHDGIPDAQDQCPNTPDLTPTDDVGCTDTTLPAAPSAADVQKVLAHSGILLNAACGDHTVAPEVSAGAFYAPGDLSQGAYIFASHVNNQPAGCPVWYFFDIDELRGDGTKVRSYSVAYQDKEADPMLVGMNQPVPPWVVQFNPKPTDVGTRALLGSAGGKVSVRFRVRAMNGAGVRGGWSDWKVTTLEDCTRLGFDCGGTP